MARAAMRYLNVAEKNDAAKHIAALLARGGAQRREGLSRYNKLYEFEANVFGVRSHMLFTSVSGHLLTCAFGSNYKNWRACDPLALFQAPIAKLCPEDYRDIQRTLQREALNCQGLIIWTDCDREGENIGFEIIQVCTEVKPDLKIYRAKFSEITAASIKRALENLGAPNKNISDAVDVRQELDLRIGAAFTRFQTLRLQSIFPQQLTNSLVSYGSCQFPTLGFVVERYKAVENFVPEKFWKISVTHTLNELTVEFNWKRTRMFDEQACTVIHDICNENPTATVQTIKSKPKSKWRPLPLDTIEMEKLSSRKLRINAKEAMKIAEKLYTQGIISYPRTETNIYPKELDLNNLVNLHIENPEWGFFAKRIMDFGGPNPRQGKKSDQAHPPIHPIKHVNNLSGDEKKIYDLVVRSFLACLSKDAQGHETTVEIDIAGEKFTANGLMIIERNYLDVYPYDKWSAKEIHVYQEGQTFAPTTLDMITGQTSAPALLTEADLIVLMEKHGIGTDATHADHIETIKSRSYVALADNIHFVPGHLGIGLVDGYDSMGLNFSKPHLRAGLEADLKEICEGRKSPNVVLSQQIARYRDIYIKVSQEATKIDQALSERFNQQPMNNAPAPIFNETVMKCNKCGSDMTLRSKKDNQGFFVSCMGYPQCKNAIWLPSIVDKVTVTDQRCETCGPSHLKLEFCWKNRSLNHLYPPPYVACLGGCDAHFLQTLNVNPGPQTQVTQSANRTNGDSGIGSSFARSSQSTQSTVNNRNHSNSSSNWSSSNENNVQQSQQRIVNGNSASTINNRFNETNNSRATHDNFRQPTSQRSVPSNPTSVNRQNNDDDNSVVCNCGEPALLLTVRKASPNMGRQFYKCQKPKENNGCNFFLWATPDQPGEETNSNSQRNNTNFATSNNTDMNNSWGNSAASTSNTRNNDWNAADTNAPQCQCNLPSKKIKVQKEGPNKGRYFYGCSNSGDSRCKFFEWADDNASSTINDQPSTSWEPSRRGRGASSQRGGTRAPGERAKKRCGNCREEGHTRNKCPRLT